jgi:hypothetical protein
MYALHFDSFFARTPVKVKNVRKEIGLAETFLRINKMGDERQGSENCNMHTFRS